MIALAVALALTFAWACIATAVAVAQSTLRSRAELQCLGYQALLDSERDRKQATSLSEYHAARAIAMQPTDNTPPPRYVYDETGLVQGVAFPVEADVPQPEPWD